VGANVADRMEQPIDALAERGAVAADGDTVTLAEK
jgi:hypothetical protein